MLGAIAGDIIGSVFEFNPIKTTDFTLFCPDSFFTDDTVMTIAVAEVILDARLRGHDAGPADVIPATAGIQGAAPPPNARLQGHDAGRADVIPAKAGIQGIGPIPNARPQWDYAAAFRRLGRAYPNAGYGGRFGRWLTDPHAGPYNSWGNGSAMRVGPVGFAFDTVEDVLREAERSAVVTHNHPQGIKGAQATALAILMARQGQDKETIRRELAARFRYDLSQTVDTIRPGYAFDESCQGTVPQALIAFFDSSDFEDAIRKAVSLGGDADTLACITGGIAQAYYGGVPAGIVAEVRARLPEEFLRVVDQFGQAYLR